MLKAWNNDAPLDLGPALERGIDGRQDAGKSGKAAEDAAAEAHHRLRRAPAGRQTRTRPAANSMKEQ